MKLYTIPASVQLYAENPEAAIDAAYKFAKEASMGEIQVIVSEDENEAEELE